MKEIPLTREKVALVDDSDYDALIVIKWQAHFNTRSKHWYAQHAITGGCIHMHRAIMNPPDNMMVDHRDRNTLNNQRYNLRLATRSYNLANSKTRIHSSKYKGVSWNKNSGVWVANVNKDGVRYRLGLFNDEIDAARAYDARAVELFGDFARINFP